MPQNMVIDIQLSLYCLSVKLKFCPFIKSIFVLSNKSTLKQSSKKHPTIAINPDGFLKKALVFNTILDRLGLIIDDAQVLCIHFDFVSLSCIEDKTGILDG